LGHEPLYPRPASLVGLAPESGPRRGVVRFVRRQFGEEPPAVDPPDFDTVINRHFGLGDPGQA